MDYTKLRTSINTVTSRPELYQTIVNAPFAYKVETAFMFLGIIVLLIVNEETGMIDRVALSNTELAQNTTTVSVKPFHDIKIPVDSADNIIATAIKTNAPQETTDWMHLFTPALTADEARLNQASGGIAYSAVYPLKDSKHGAAMIFSYYQYSNEIDINRRAFMNEYSKMINDLCSYNKFMKI